MRSAADIDEVGWPDPAAALRADRVDAQLLPELVATGRGRAVMLVWLRKLSAADRQSVRSQ